MTNDTLFQTLSQCVKLCRVCTQECLSTKDNYEHGSMLRLSIECADFCNVTMKLLLLNSTYTVKAAALCAEICNELATACFAFPQHRIRQCAIVCLEVAEQCDTFIEERMLEGNKFPGYIHYN